jgi:hypothetical protein
MNRTYEALRYLARTGEIITLSSREGAGEIVAEVERVEALQRALSEAEHQTRVANERADGAGQAGQVQALTRRLEGAEREVLRLLEIIVKLRLRINEVVKCANRPL